MPSSRQSKLNWFRRQYDAEIHDRRVDIERDDRFRCGTSLGTYILGLSLLRFEFDSLQQSLLVVISCRGTFPGTNSIEAVRFRPSGMNMASAILGEVRAIFRP